MAPSRTMAMKPPRTSPRFIAALHAVAVFVIAPSALSAQGALPQDQIDAIDALAAEPVSEGRVAGLSIAVVRGADTLIMRAYGSADLELDVAMPPDAVYEIGSVTKQFTAAAILMLQEDGKLSLDDPLTQWMPDYPVGDRSLTLRRLLDHTSGIKGYTEIPSFGAQIAALDLPRDTLVTLFAAEPFDFEPGTALIYNNSAYFLLGLIIEKASGQTYEEFVEQRLFAASGMSDSRYCHKDELTPHRAKGYEPGEDGLRPAAYLNHLWPYAAGSLCSTVRDLMAWNQALHGDGEGGHLLGEDGYRQLITPEPLVDGTPVRYAKGLVITQRAGQPRISHGGGIFGFVSELRYLPEEDLSIAVLINTAGRVSPSQIAREIEDVLLGPEPTVIPRYFGGDLTPYTGSYRGPGRGRRLSATVSVEDGQLMIKIGPAPPRQVAWLGEHTFGDGATRFRFVRDEEGLFAELRLDQVVGHYVLRRLTR